MQAGMEEEQIEMDISTAAQGQEVSSSSSSSQADAFFIRKEENMKSSEKVIKTDVVPLAPAVHLCKNCASNQPIEVM